MWGYAFARAAKKCRFPVMRAVAVLTTQQIGGHLAQPRADPNCSVTCGKVAWIGTGRTWQVGEVMLKTVTDSMNTLRPVTDALLETLEMDDGIVLQCNGCQLT